MKKFRCGICESVYDESIGDPVAGIKPGTRWDDVPEDWLCPDCGGSKAGFEVVES